MIQAKFAHLHAEECSEYGWIDVGDFTLAEAACEFVRCNTTSPVADLRWQFDVVVRDTDRPDIVYDVTVVREVMHKAICRRKDGVAT